MLTSATLFLSYFSTCKSLKFNSFKSPVYVFIKTFLVAQMVKLLFTMWETWVGSLGREDPLEKEMAIYFSTIAWKIPWTEEPGRLQSMG